jgi:hypothetical protein
MPDRRTRITALVVTFLAVMAFLTIRVIHLEHKLHSPWLTDPRIAETTHLLPNEAMKVLALGFEPFVSDMVFMEANNYFTTHLGLDRTYAWLDRYLAVIVGYCRGPDGSQVFLPPLQCQEALEHHWVEGLFPFNPRVYLWASQAMKYEKKITNKAIDKAVYYGRTGIHFCPDSWELYSDVGFNLFFEYRDLDRDTSENLKREALSYFSKASTLPNSKESTFFALTILWNREDHAAALRQFYLSYYHSKPEDRENLRKKLRSQGFAELHDVLEAEEKELQEQFPYYPPELLNFLGSRRQLLTKSPFEVRR